jgi:cyclic pyranopterin phosphate synthase
MLDAFGREITYLRVSVTERCNLNCVYCGKEECAKRDAELTPGQIEKIVRAAAACGVTKVRLTGGEPLVRDDICEIAERIRGIPGVKTLSLTTNGVYLRKYAAALKAAGVDSVNVSLDSADGSTYRHLTGADVLHKVLDGIDAARAAGLSPIKINAVLMKGVNADGAGKLIDLARTEALDVRFIELMPFSDPGEDKNLRVTGEEILRDFPFLKPTGETEGTAVYYAAPGFSGRVGLISPVSKKFCKSCNRIRLLSDGFIRPCLGYDTAFDLKPYLDDEEKLLEAVQKAILAKPAGHDFTGAGGDLHAMNKIGG